MGKMSGDAWYRGVEKGRWDLGERGSGGAGERDIEESVYSSVKE